ncbi:MAG: FAD-dependent oxidoreductase [Oceanisphaera sp.]|uniref:FAD-dependent oxidoreductase n=1 Tax=Oceanisphaera sp. TaxID=1929979 RepID=UPI003C71474C
MNVFMVGGGVVGITAANVLLKREHEVCLLERNDGLGLETSFANYGQLSYRYVSLLAESSILWQALSWMMLQRFAAALLTEMEPCSVEFVPFFYVEHGSLGFTLACGSAEVISRQHQWH